MYSWNLDSVGNWTQATAVDYDGVATTENRTHNKLHQLIEAGGGDYYHDPNGNMIETPSQWLTFDALNRLTAVTPKGNTQDVAFRYDAQGRRIRKTVAGETATKTDYIYSGIQCVEERNAITDAMTKQYVWGHYVDELLQIKTADGSRFYPLQDLLYRTNALTDGYGNVVEEYDTDAYGNTLFTPADENVETPTCEFIFTGRRLDPETGLYYYRARYYNPSLGRFISKDPLGYVDGMGLYEYVISAPLAGVDPSGYAHKSKNKFWDRKAISRNSYERRVKPCTIVIEFGHALDIRWANAISGKLRADKNKLSARGTLACFADIFNRDVKRVFYKNKNVVQQTTEFKKNHSNIIQDESRSALFGIISGTPNDIITGFPQIKSSIGGGLPNAWDNQRIDDYRKQFGWWDLEKEAKYWNGGHGRGREAFAALLSDAWQAGKSEANKFAKDEKCCDCPNQEIRLVFYCHPHKKKDKNGNIYDEVKRDPTVGKYCGEVYVKSCQYE